jgi:B12-binding domain/radical SAM domain protein
MYPIGFTTIAEYLERHGFRVRIANLALRMLKDERFDVERFLSRLNAAAFGIDLHWLPHAHGGLEVARIVKRLHPNTPIIFGGFSSTYYHEELVRRPEVDYVVRGDSTEGPVLALMRYISSGGKARPSEDSSDGKKLATLPNVAWKDSEHQVHVNPLAPCPPDLDDLLFDYGYVLKAVMRYRDFSNFLPFRAFTRYPITAALSVRGCRYNCATCGGSAYAFRKVHGRSKPSYRSPENLAEDIRSVARFSRGPVFVLGDIRQAGDDYASRFLEAIHGHKKPVILELFNAAPPAFFKQVANALPNFTIEVSLESHDDKVRKAFGRPYNTEAIERTMAAALDAGCQRLDVFFMVGLAEQTYQSVMDTIDYCAHLMQKFDSPSDGRLIPFISPLAPFLDPGSRAFEDPDKHGYRLRWRTLEEHRKALAAPSWKYVLNYETAWMDRDEIVSSTYEAGMRLNRLKAEHGVIEAKLAEATDKRIKRAIELMHEVDRIMTVEKLAERKARLDDLRSDMQAVNLSTVCDKRELELPMRGQRLRWLPAARLAVSELLKRNDSQS